MKKISYLQLQKKYAGHVVALDKQERRVLASSKRFPALFKQLEKKRVSPERCVFVGPIQKSGTINVYRVSVRNQTH